MILPMVMFPTSGAAGDADSVCLCLRRIASCHIGREGGMDDHTGLQVFRGDQITVFVQEDRIARNDQGDKHFRRVAAGTVVVGDRYICSVLIIGKCFE